MGFRIGIVCGLHIAVMCAIVIVLNQLTLQNDTFVVIMSFVSAVGGIVILKNDVKEANEKLQVKVQNILDNP